MADLEASAYAPAGADLPPNRGGGDGSRGDEAGSSIQPDSWRNSLVRLVTSAIPASAAMRRALSLASSIGWSTEFDGGLA